MSAISLLALLIFPLLMAFAASSDLLTMRISNRLVLILVVAFFALAFFVGLPLQLIGMHLACAALVLVFAFAFFAFGWIGGGDAKLIAATTLWLGFGMMLPYLIYASLLGGALTLYLLAARRWPLPERLYNNYKATASGPAADARFVNVGEFDGDSHRLFSSRHGIALWLPEVDAFFHHIGMPFDDDAPEDPPKPAGATERAS